jgi:hypothetical protein
MKPQTSRALLCCAAASALLACQRPPSLARLDGANPYLAYPEGGAINCSLPNDRLFALTLGPEDGAVCLARSLMGAHVAPLVEIQRCHEGESCVPCEGSQCGPSACFPRPAVVALDDPNCWLPLEADPFDDQTHYVVLKPTPPGSSSKATPVPLLPQILIVSRSTEVSIVTDPLNDTFQLGRFGPRIAGPVPPSGGDCDSGNCGIFPVAPVDQSTMGFSLRPPSGVTGWQGSPF